MQEIPETRESLLLQIQGPENQVAWEEFVELYRPVVYRIGMSKGLQHADALDLVQNVFISIAGSIAHWEKREDHTRFRHWLFRVAKNATLNALTRRPWDQPIGGDTVAYDLANRAAATRENESELDLEYRRQIYLRAAEVVRKNVKPATWKAFELTAVQGMAIEEAAIELGRPIGAIYTARSRIMKQLSDLVAHQEALYQ